MNRVFSAKRKFIEFDYEFIDGTKSTFAYYELAQKDIDELVDKEEQGLSTSEKLKYRLELFKKQLLHTDKKLVDKLLKEQYEYGNIYDLITELDNMLNEVRKKK